jgi:hypothetical protein
MSAAGADEAQRVDEVDRAVRLRSSEWSASPSLKAGLRLGLAIMQWRWPRPAAQPSFPGRARLDHLAALLGQHLGRPALGHDRGQPVLPARQVGGVGRIFWERTPWPSASSSTSFSSSLNIAFTSLWSAVKSLMASALSDALLLLLLLVLAVFLVSGIFKHP